MKNLRILVLSCIIAVAVMHISAYKLKAAAGDDMPEKGVVSAELSNGIKVLLMDRGYAPTLALIISFRVGSVEESYSTAGAAHMLEHMLFKGTDKIGTRDFRKEKRLLDRIEAVGETLDRLKLINPENTRIPELEEELKDLQKEHSRHVTDERYDKIYSQSGGVGFNAGTSRDSTSYYIELPSERLELWADLESERLRNPVLREYYTERDTVYEERLMRYESSGTASLFEALTAAAFTAHPYRHPIIGWRSNIKYLSIRDIRRFYNTYYIPQRMTITIVGKQDTSRTLGILEEKFGKIDKRPDPFPIAIREPAQKGERRVMLKYESNPHLLIAWHRPAFPDRMDYVGDTIQNLLADGKTSRLYSTLVQEKKIASSVSAWNGYPGARYDSLFIISASPRPPYTVEDLEKAIYGEIEQLKKDITPRELQRVVNRIESSMVFSLTTNMGIARYLNYYQTVLGDWRYMYSYVERMKSVTAGEIKEALDTFFTEDNRTVAILIDTRKKAE